MARATVVAEDTAAAELAEEGGAVMVSGDVERIASTFDEILGDDAMRAALGEAGRAYVLKHHRRQAMARRYEALYDELLSR